MEKSFLDSFVNSKVSLLLVGYDAPMVGVMRKLIEPADGYALERPQRDGTDAYVTFIAGAVRNVEAR